MNVFSLKTRFLIGFGFVFCFSSFDLDAKKNAHPKLATIHIVDRNGFSETVSNPDRIQQYQKIDFTKPQPYQKVLRVYQRDRDGNIPSYITSYYENGYPKQYLACRNGRAFGLYQEWHKNGVPSLKVHVIGGTADLNHAAEQSWLFDGKSLVWNEEGRLLAEIGYSKGELNGMSTYYHANGKIWKQIPYRQNKIEGVFSIFLETGELFQTIFYQKGLKEGTSYRYWSLEKVAAEEQYREGLLQQALYFDQDGKQVGEIQNGNGFRVLFGKEKIAETQEYHNGIQEGEVRQFHPNGQLVRRFSIKNGLKQGEEIEYAVSFSREPAKPVLLISWYEGKIQGVCKTWYGNGQLESQREMMNNKKNGLLTAWYEDGNLMMIEEYDADLLVKGEYYKKEEKNPVSLVRDGEGLVTLFDCKGNFIQKVLYVHGKPDDLT